jgi:hypothetical protein
MARSAIEPDSEQATLQLLPRVSRKTYSLVAHGDGGQRRGEGSVGLLAPVVRRVVQAGHERAVLLVVHRRLVVGIDWRVAEQAIGVPLIHLLRGIQLRKGAQGGKHLDLGRELSRSGFRRKIEGGRKGERERESVERGWETESASERGSESRGAPWVG